MKSLLIHTLLLLSVFTYAQEPHWDAQLLEKTKGKKVICWEAPYSNTTTWTAIVKVKKKVGLYLVSMTEDINEEGNVSTNVDDVNEQIEPKYKEIGAFISVNKEDSDRVDYLQGFDVKVAEVPSKKKTGIIIQYGDSYDVYYMDAKDFFQAIDWEQNKGTHVPVLNNEKWGIYDWYHQKYVFNCDYAYVEALPKTTDPYGFNEYSIEIFKAFNDDSERDNIDIIDLDGNNGDGLFKARSAKTHKWGLYQYLGDRIVEAIPMKYDSLHHFQWNGNYTAVFNDGKVGFYLSYWSYDEDARQTVPCIYEDYKRYTTEEDQIPRLAVKKEGKWGWVDWLTGEEKSEFTYETPDNLPYPWYEQKLWLEE